MKLSWQGAALVSTSPVSQTVPVHGIPRAALDPG